MSILESLRTSVAKALLPQPYRAYPKYDPLPARLVHQEFGRSGLRRYYPGWIRDEPLPELQGRRKYLTYHEMGDMNAYCAASLNAFSMFMRRAKWDVDPVENENKTNGSAKFLKSCMQDQEHAWQTFIASASRVVPQYGFGTYELVYKRREGKKEDYRYSSKYDDGYIGWQSFAIRSPPTILHWVWYPDDPNRLQGLRQLTPPDFPPDLFIPIEKLLLLRAEPGEDNPEGRSILRSSYKPFFSIKYFENARNVIIENAGTGIPYADVPPEISNPYKIDPATGEYVLDDEGNPIVDRIALSTLESIKATLKSMRLNEEPFVIKPAKFDENKNRVFDIGYLTNNGGAMIADLNTSIHEEGMKILMSMMSEFLAMGTNSTGGGSFALSKDKTDNFSLAITAYLDAFEDSINAQAVTRLFELNPQFDCEVLPKIVHTDIVPIDMREVAMVLGGFRGVGWDISEDEEIKNFILDDLGLPKSTSKKTVPVAPMPASGAGGPKPPSAKAQGE